ncbi:hypothetical protein ACP70R_009552 [Stipagrostis hirtigluma subsp. patula]
MAGGGSPRGRAQGAPLLPLLALALCALLPTPSSAAFFLGARSGTPRVPPQPRGDGGREEKVPMTVVVPSDYSPRPAPLAAPAPAPAPVPGSDGGDDGSMPRLPSERRSPGGAPWSGDGAGARAPAAASTDFISSNPAVPLPAGVTDSATVLPMPTPGHQRQDDVGMGTPQLRAMAVQLAVPLVVTLYFWHL